MKIPPPNDAIKELESVLGEDGAREIVRLFLRDFPRSVRLLSSLGREEQSRIVHGLKSSAFHMGAKVLSDRLAAIERQLAIPRETLEPEVLATAIADFGAIAPGLRKYAGV